MGFCPILLRIAEMTPLGFFIMFSFPTKKHIPGGSYFPQVGVGWERRSISELVRGEDNPESPQIKFKAHGVSILTLFLRALYPGNYFYLFPSHFLSFGKNPEIKSLSFSFEVFFPPGIPLHDTTLPEDSFCQHQPLAVACWGPVFPPSTSFL